MHFARKRLAVRHDDEHIHVQTFVNGAEHGERAVGGTERCIGCRDELVQRHAAPDQMVKAAEPIVCRTHGSQAVTVPRTRGEAAHVDMGLGFIEHVRKRGGCLSASDGSTTHAR